MKITNLLLSGVILLGFIACKKPIQKLPQEPFTPPSFKATQYTFLGSYDTLGRPLDYLLKPDSLSIELLNFIKSALPEGEDIRKSNPSLISSNSDLKIQQKSEVFITFVAEGAGQLNTLGYYTYTTSSPPQNASDLKEVKYIFPNASLTGWGGGGLVPGDKIKIGNFDSGISIGFVLIQNGWDKISKKVNPKGFHFCSNEIVNPENDPALKKHTVLINYHKENKIFIGFEDAMRTEPSCDHDFNDLVIYATIKNPL